MGILDQPPAAIIAATKRELAGSFVAVENVTTEADVAPAIARIVAAGRGTLRVPDGVTLELSSEVSLPNEVTSLIIDGAVKVTTNSRAFCRDGEPVGSNISITSPIFAGERTVAANGATLATGDWVFVVSADVVPSRGTLPTTGDKLGYMRQIRSIGAGTVTFDSPIPRDMPSSTRRMRKINLAAPLFIGGHGEVYQSDPASCDRSLFQFFFCRDIFMSKPLFLHDGGGPAVFWNHVVGFEADVRIDNFIDDLPNGHVGYGHNVSGSSRDGRIGGVISRVRHAFTTNVGGNHPQFVYYGEPENVVADPVTRYCTDKALDTHRPGIGIKLVCRDIGSGGQVQVRADDVHVDIHAAGVYSGDVLTVWDYVVIPPTVNSLVVRDVTTNVVKADSDVVFNAFPRKIGSGGSMFALAAGAVMSMPAETRSVVKAADQSVTNSTTLVACTGMGLPLEANAVYEIDGYLITSASQAGDLKVGWNPPTGAVMTWTVNGLSTGTTSTGGTIVRSSGTATSDQGVGGVGSPDSVAMPKGYITTSNAGTLQMTFAQQAADATASIIRAGSRLTVRRIA